MRRSQHRLWGATLGVLLLCARDLAGCFPRQPSAAQCVYNGDCVEPLVCAGRRCRAQCQSDRDCVTGASCVSSGQLGFRVCVPTTDPRPCLLDTECPSPQLCTVEGFCGPQCLADSDCAVYVLGSRCVCVGGVGTCSFNPAAASDGGRTDGAACPAEGGVP